MVDRTASVDCGGNYFEWYISGVFLICQIKYFQFLLPLMDPLLSLLLISDHSRQSNAETKNR